MSVVGLVESYTTTRESSSISAARKYIESHETLSMSVIRNVRLWDEGEF